MPQNSYDIFISYRRKDENGKEWGTNIARNVYQAFESRGYKGRVFLDHSHIGPEDFEAKILGAIKQSKVFVFIITKDSLNRCVAEGDWVRREILQAIELNLKIILINPDLEFNGEFPDGFPDELSTIKTQNRMELRSGSGFDIDMDNIVKNYIDPIIYSHQVTFTTDTDCRIYNLGKFLATIKQGETLSIGFLDSHALLEFEAIHDKLPKKKMHYTVGELDNKISIKLKPNNFVRIAVILIVLMILFFCLFLMGRSNALDKAQESIDKYKLQMTTKSYLELREAKERMDKFWIDSDEDVYREAAELLK